MKKLEIAVLVALAASCLLSVAQESPTIEIAAYAGLTATVTEAGVYNIEATTDLSQEDGWSVVGTLELKAGEPTLWVDTSAPVAGKRFYRLVKSLVVVPVPNMVEISPGTFTMGSPDTEVGRNLVEGPQTQVTLTKGFYMGKYEVTQAEYLSVTGKNPSRYSGDTKPVESVTWFKAVEYCEALTAMERDAGRIPADWSYRLPTEAEWEYTCRAGTTTAYSFGNDPALLGDYAWFRESEFVDSPYPVGGKLPNAWGLHDMHGNVWEWCLDNSEAYPGGSVVNPVGNTVSNSRVQRGGGLAHPSQFCRSAQRGSENPSIRVEHRGFRVVLAPVR